MTAIKDRKAKALQDASTSPIAKVNDDILLLIFKINSNMADDDPLGDHHRITPTTLRAINTTRHSSQVNSVWRNVIVYSPTLWANLLDISLLDRASTHWRETVIRRTRLSPLHVKGDSYLKVFGDTGSWIPGFLNANWKRIRKFDFVVLADRKSESAANHPRPTYYSGPYRNTLPWLSKPAPALESFNMTFPVQYDPLETGTTLFSGRAPLLRSFQTRRMMVPIRQNPAWFSQLHLLQISGCSMPTFASVDALYQILSQMPHLECLSLEDTIHSPYISLQRYPIRLPSLTKIQIYEDGRNNFIRKGCTNALACWPLLNSLIPKAGCSFDLTIKLINIAEIDIPMLCRFARNYFDVHQPPISIELGSGLKSFWITDYDISTEEPPSQEPFFCLRIDTLGPVTTADRTIYRLFEGMSFLTFPRVTKICFIICTSHSVAFSDPKFAKLLRSLTSLESLSATPTTLRALCSSPLIKSSSQSLFPQLKVLSVPDFRTPSEYDINVPLSDILTSFLSLQKAAGNPVQRVEYKADFSDGSLTFHDLTPLDKYKGLKVVWDTNEIGHGEYICGSGQPAELNLAMKLKLSQEQGRRAGLTFTDLCLDLWGSGDHL